MAPYESDSSLSDAGECTETKVLLGYASSVPTDDPISQLGGEPTWLSTNKPPSATLARCKSCQGVMRLLLQLDGNLPDYFPDHQRRLYIFSCTKRTCKRKDGCVRVIRGVKLEKRRSDGQAKTTEMEVEDAEDATEEEERKSHQKRDIGRELFGSGSTSKSTTAMPSNPFAAGGGAASQQHASAPINPFASLDHPSSLAAKPPQKSPTPTNPFASLDHPSSLAAKPPQKQAPPPADGNELTESFASKVSLNLPSAPAASSARHPQRQQRAAIPSSSELWPSPENLPKPYPRYFLDAEYESLEKKPSTSFNTSSTKKGIMDNDDEEEKEKEKEKSASSSRKGSRRFEDDNDKRGKKSQRDDDEKEAFESTLDKTFQRFADRVSQNPEQVLRYDFGGWPLLYSVDDAVGRFLMDPLSQRGMAAKEEAGMGIGRGTGIGRGMPRCENCGSERTFEVQLMPHAITELENHDFENENNNNNNDSVDGNSQAVKETQQKTQQAVFKKQKGKDDENENTSDEKGNEIEVGKGAGHGDGNGSMMTISSILEWGTIIIGVCSRDCLVSSDSVSASRSARRGDGGGGGGGGKNGTEQSGELSQRGSNRERNEDKDDKDEEEDEEEEDEEVIGYKEEWVGVQWE